MRARDGAAAAHQRGLALCAEAVEVAPVQLLGYHALHHPAALGHFVLQLRRLATAPLLLLLRAQLGHLVVALLVAQLGAERLQRRGQLLDGRLRAEGHRAGMLNAAREQAASARAATDILLRSAGAGVGQR